MKQVKLGRTPLSEGYTAVLLWRPGVLLDIGFWFRSTLSGHA